MFTTGSVRDYNRRYSGEARSLLEHLRDLPVLLRHLVSFIWSGEGITWLFRLRIFILGAMAGVYLLSPFDIVPEAVFGLIGILDDIIVLALFALYAGILYRNFVVDNGNWRRNWLFNKKKWNQRNPRNDTEVVKNILTCSISFRSMISYYAFSRLKFWCLEIQYVFLTRSLFDLYGGFQLLDLIITELKSQMTCYNSMPLIGWNYSIQTWEQIL